MPNPRRFTPVMDRLMRRVVRESAPVDGLDECWVWTGAVNNAGYGQIGVGSKVDGTNRMRSVHRIVYENRVGPIDEGLVLDHMCRRPRCVNPEHLEPVTQRVNNHRGATNAAKTHCSQGHPYNGDNLYYCPPDRRRCRACDRARNRARRERRIEEAA